MAAIRKFQPNGVRIAGTIPQDGFTPKGKDISLFDNADYIVYGQSSFPLLTLSQPLIDFIYNSREWADQEIVKVWGYIRWDIGGEEISMADIFVYTSDGKVYHFQM